MLERLAFIKQAQALGFSLDEVKRIIDDARAGTSPCDGVREIVQHAACMSSMSGCERCVVIAENSPRRSQSGTDSAKRRGTSAGLSKRQEPWPHRDDA